MDACSVRSMRTRRRYLHSLPCFLRPSPPLRLEFALSARLASQQVPEVCLSPRFVLGLQDTGHHAQIVCECQESELSKLSMHRVASLASPTVFLRPGSTIPTFWKPSQMRSLHQNHLIPSLFCMPHYCSAYIHLAFYFI